MKPNWPKRIGGLPEAAEKAVRDINTMLSNGLMLADNAFAAIASYKFTHGVAQTLPSPLRGGSIPIGFSPIYAVDSNGAKIPVPNCQFDRAVGGGKFGLTVYAEPVVEFVRGFLLNTSAVTLTGAPPTTANIVSISLTPGEWDLSAIVLFYAAAGATGTRLTAGINTVSATLPAASLYGDSAVESPTMPTASASNTLTIPSYRVKLTTTTTYYLVAQAAFTAGGIVAWGRLSARRVDVDSAAAGTVTGILWGG